MLNTTKHHSRVGIRSDSWQPPGSHTHTKNIYCGTERSSRAPRKRLWQNVCTSWPLKTPTPPAVCVPGPPHTMRTVSHIQHLLLQIRRHTRYWTGQWPCKGRLQRRGVGFLVRSAAEAAGRPPTRLVATGFYHNTTYRLCLSKGLSPRMHK